MPTKQSRVPWNKDNPKRERRPDGRYHTWRWTKFSRWYRKTFPVCVECGHAAEVVDHIKPARVIDEKLFYDTSNMQSLCHRCHNRKRATDDKQWNK